MVTKISVCLARRLCEKVPRYSNVNLSRNFTLFAKPEWALLRSFRNIHETSIQASARAFVAVGGCQGNNTLATTADNCGGNKFAPACIAANLVAAYEEIVDLPNHPEKLLIDVREPTELAATGQIPTSINIPLKTIRNELSISPESFELKYGRKKPAADDPIIFSCRSGVRAGQAAFEADKLGFRNVKNYVGSWQEYGPKHGLPIQ